MSKKATQAGIIMEYFQGYPNRAIAHPEIVDWAREEYQRRTGKTFRDPYRQIRKLHQQGLLIKIARGIYKYAPESIQKNKLEDFTEQQKKAILERDAYRCAVCGKGPQDGVELHADHIKPKGKGGRAKLENGQTLCGTHNYRKKNYGQTETGKKMFIRLYELAKAIDDVEAMNFCSQILEVFEKNHINGHIVWKK